MRDRENRFDRGAIRIMRLNGEQLGFIPSDISRGGDPSGLAYQMDNGSKYRCRIKDITGGGGRNIGVNLELTELTETEDYAALVQRRISQLTDDDNNALVLPKPLVSRNIGFLIGVALALLLIFLIIAQSR